MDSVVIRHRLAVAERHVAEGLAVIDLQRRIIAGLERYGRDASGARLRLATVLETQTLHEQDRERLRARLKG
jgi:hypothetical protein